MQKPGGFSTGLLLWCCGLFFFCIKRLVLGFDVFDGNGFGEAHFEGEHPHDKDAKNEHKELPDPERGQSKGRPGGRGIGIGEEGVAYCGEGTKANEEPDDGEDPGGCDPFFLVVGQARDGLEEGVVCLSIFAFV